MYWIGLFLLLHRTSMMMMRMGRWAMGDEHGQRSQKAIKSVPTFDHKRLTLALEMQTTHIRLLLHINAIATLTYHQKDGG